MRSNLNRYGENTFSQYKSPDVQGYNFLCLRLKLNLALMIPSPWRAEHLVVPILET